MNPTMKLRDGHELSLDESLSVVLRTDDPHVLATAAAYLLGQGNIEGLEPALVDLLDALRHVVRHVELSKTRQNAPDKVTAPEHLVPYVRHIADEEQEHLLLVVLDNAHHVRRVVPVYKGTKDSITVRPADVIRQALIYDAAAVALAHNHPSGNPKPSPEDVRITQTLIKYFQDLGIRVLDHVIVARDGWRSMREIHPYIW